MYYFVSLVCCESVLLRPVVSDPISLIIKIDLNSVFQKDYKHKDQ